MYINHFLDVKTEPSYNISSCFRASSALFTIDRDERLCKIKNGTTVVHAWDDDCPYYDLANLTGIPSHVAILVEHQKTKQLINTNFSEIKTYVTEELDKRQMGGGLTFELIEQRISRPILDELANLKGSLHVMASADSSSQNDRSSLPTFQWSSDDNTNFPIPRLLPENYVLPTTIHPLAMWRQWHHGASFKDGIAVGPLKRIEASNCPKKFRRRFELLKKFNKQLDKTSGVSGNESIAELGKIYQANETKWQEMGILLPKKTPTKRKRSRNENSWCYIAKQWESLLILKSKSELTGVSVDVMMKQAADKEKNRQKRKREVTRLKKTGAQVNTGDGLVRINQTESEEPHTRSVNSRRQFGASAELATRLDTLLS